MIASTNVTKKNHAARFNPFDDVYRHVLPVDSSYNAYYPLMYGLFSLPLGEGWGEGSKSSTNVFDLIPLILTFSLREKGLPDLLNSVCMTLAA
jgi:hypothetical protein